MSISIAALSTLALLLASTAQSHMILTSPAPFKHVPGEGNGAINAPLNRVGTPNFPCKGATEPAAGTTSIPAGEDFTVTFDGSTVHGGGVCQFAVNYDDTPSADPARWKVIYTVLGGCPASAAGNLPELPSANNFGAPSGVQCGDSTGTECVRQFPVPFPAELPSGNANFAWIWFNRIGDREMYMDCAPIEITGGASDNSFVDSLPQIYVANAAGVGTCPVGPPEGNINIPEGHRGSAVLELEPVGPVYDAPGCGFQGGPEGGAAAPSSPNTDAAPEEPASAPAAPAAGGCSGSTQTVASGSTCSSMAEAAGVPVADFMAANPSINADCTNLQADAEVCMPALKKRSVAHPHARRHAKAL